MPTNRRLPNAFEPIFRAFANVSRAPQALTSTNQGDNLNAVPFGQSMLAVPGRGTTSRFTSTATSLGQVMRPAVRPRSPRQLFARIAVDGRITVDQFPKKRQASKLIPNDQMGKIGPLAGSTELAELGS